MRAACDHARDGQGVCAFVAGEPGIGKTALCRQLAAYADTQGMQALVGHCYEEPSLSPPYAPFVEALRAHAQALTTDQLERELGHSAPDVARLLPELSSRLGVESSGLSRGQDERWCLLSALTDFVRAAAAVQPVALILEDLHWADRGTLDLLLYLTRHLEGAPLLLVGTYRDAEVDRAHPLSNMLVELRRRPDFVRIRLRGMSRGEVQHLSTSLAARAVSEAAGEALHRQTEGNPLFVQEIVRYLIEEGLGARIEEAAGEGVLTPGLPEGVRDVIGKRLVNLSPDCNQLLGMASVIGREFDLTTLQEVADLTDQQVLAALEEAQRARVVDDTSRLRDVRFRFAHVLFRQAVYEELFTPRRLLMHQRVAHALQRRHAQAPEEHAAELAEHFLQSADAADLDKALQYAELAARRAMRVSAYGEAARHLRTALAVQATVAPDAHEQRCDLWLALGQAMIGAGELEAVVSQVAPEALKLAEILDDGRRVLHTCRLAGEALLARAGVTSVRTAEFQAWIERVVRWAGPSMFGQVSAHTGRAMVLSGTDDEAGARFFSQRGLELARESGDLTAIRTSARYRSESWLWSADRQQERLALVQDLVESTFRDATDGDPTPHPPHFYDTQHFQLFNAGDILLTWGQRDRAEAMWTVDLAERLKYPWSGLMAMRTQLILACLDGELEHAFEIAAALVREAELQGAGPYGREYAAVHLRRPQLYLGRAGEALAEFHHELEAVPPAAIPVFGLWGMYAAQRAVCLAHAGRLADAQAILTRFLTARSIGQPRDETPMPTAVALLELATTIGAREAAARLAESLDVAAQFVAADGTLTIVARHLGAALALIGDHQRALAVTEQGVELAERVRFRPELALLRVQLAELELGRGRRSDARRHLEHVTAELETMHMQPALRHARRLQSRC